ncbi:hypothetical protein AXK56_10515 [Tsukamurella pulmonis]|uniref:DnaB-like helicase N terminal domain-containing protein n=1 Tax=Tsukamurella pulmonis TaxID=47312 RepID=A0A1H1FE33_9ACTN|nr:hypothetical protein [Tsukamurella pulmonis]KXO88742.1 hypothetical protein AXK56_10515 [Tsukamurella pulmonis]SDQ99232.1 hypothetical protein SAMN04489765_2667 [Tsukamurella pulmonis]SUP19596.1 Uncharacterised protein [Tsukamurella pulmonis]
MSQAENTSTSGDAGDEQAAYRHVAGDAAESIGAARTGATEAAAATEALRQVMQERADVFDASPTLAHVRSFADARRAGHWATLLGVLQRTTLAVPPYVVLPPIIGGEVSLNLLTALVGVSSGGKGAADKTAAAAIRFTREGARMPTPSVVPLGSGEGINRTFATARKAPLGGGATVMRWHKTAALFGVRDIAHLVALAGRSGSTLLPELLKAAMGEELGFANADAERRVILPMHSYRLCMSAGVQFDNGVALLNDQAQRDGVPQRFVWAPTRQGEARKLQAAPDKPLEPMEIELPDFGSDPFSVPEGADDDLAFNPEARELIPLDLHPSITAEIIAADAAKDLDPFGRSGDPLAGHRLLTQEKVAAALAVLHGRTAIEPMYWQLAAAILDVSAATSRAVAAESGIAAQRDAERQGELDGHRRAAADTVRDAAAIAATADRIESFLRKRGGWVASSEVRKAVSSRLRQHFEEAQLALQTSKRIELRRDTNATGQSVTYYRLRQS